MSSAEDARLAAGQAPPASWRFLLRPRWLGWHLAMLASVAGMLALGYWQLRRAEAGNALSWAYTFEWPVFAVFAVVFWAKTIRDEFHPPQAGQAGGRPEPGAGAPAPGPAGPGEARGPGQAEPADEAPAADNADLARLQEQV